MAVVMFGGSLVALLLNAFRWLSYLATAVIAWTGADMVLHDHGLDSQVDLPRAIEITIPLLVAAGIVLFAHWFHRYRPARRRVGPPAPAG
jgi:predicted tellurium resistance membrane protein TerC